MKLNEIYGFGRRMPTVTHGECADCNSPMTVRSSDAVAMEDGSFGGWPNSVCPDCGAKGTFNPEHPDDEADREDY